MREMRGDVLIVGGGTGGVAAAVAACEAGKRVVLSERYAWLGGQLTSQAVPPDENFWIETHGGTRRYRHWRELVRRYYRDHYPLNAAARANAMLNPGGGYVSKLCCEPGVALAAIEQMLAPHRSTGRLTVLQPWRPVAAETDATGDRVTSVTLERVDAAGERLVVTAPYVLDATELGDLLPLAGVEYVSGAESRDQTGELHAADRADADNVQSLTWCFALGWDTTPGADHTIDKPAQWERWRDDVPAVRPAWPGKLLDWHQPAPWELGHTRKAYLRKEHAQPDCANGYFAYRQIVTRSVYDASVAEGVEEVTMVNWPMNDYMAGNLIDASPADEARYLEEARQLSLSLVYWLQTEAEDWAGGTRGFPRLRLRPDLMGTADGLAQAPYIRESRRIRARFTVTEQHVGTEMRLGINPLPTQPDERAKTRGHAAEAFADSVGIGHYRIDLHISTGGDNYIDVSALPFQIPLGSLVPQRMRNLLPACKNIGTTHITNGCYRLHPVEWNIGEAAGALAAYCLDHDTEPHAVLDDADRLRDFQATLTRAGVPLQWPTTCAI